jgi:hypothetical protein
MTDKSLVAVYEGEGVIRLRERPSDLQKDQKLLIAIVPLPTEREAPPSAAYFRQLVAQLQRYEKKYGMTSEVFYKKFQSGEIPEGPTESPFDYFDWRTLYDGCQYMQAHFGLSREALTDDV